MSEKQIFDELRVDDSGSKYYLMAIDRVNKEGRFIAEPHSFNTVEGEGELTVSIVCKKGGEHFYRGAFSSEESKREFQNKIIEMSTFVNNYNVGAISQGRVPEPIVGP